MDLQDLLDCLALMVDRVFVGHLELLACLETKDPEVIPVSQVLQVPEVSPGHLETHTIWMVDLQEMAVTEVILTRVQQLVNRETLGLEDPLAPLEEEDLQVLLD